MSSGFHRAGRPLHRRAVLRGAGAAIALPFLEAMTPTRVHGASGSAGAPTPPLRLVWMYVPNGVNLAQWRQPAVEHDALRAVNTLEPLAPFAGEVSMLSGLDCRTARANGDGPGDHARAAGSWLTCVQPLKADGAVRVGRSADQVAAEQLAGDSLFGSIALGGEDPRTGGQCDSGYSCAYSSHISWRDATQPLSKQSDPGRVFDLLFRGGSHAGGPEVRRERARKRRSILDFVGGEAARLRGTLAGQDRETLERYLESLRELERRLQRFEEEYLEAVPDGARPRTNPGDLFERLRLMADLIALAFTTDRTRVATLLCANEGSNRSFPALDVNEGHHPISHHGDEPHKLEQIARIDRAYVEVLAYLLDRLAVADPTGSSLLDRSAVVYGSCIADGNKHRHDDLPTLLAGRLGGSLRPGRHVRFEPGTPLANLHLSLQQRVGCRVESFADSTGPLTNL